MYISMYMLRMYYTEQVELLDTKGAATEVRLVRVVINKLEKAQQKKAEVAEMEEEAANLQAELNKLIKESESAEAKAAAVVAAVYASSADGDQVCLTSTFSLATHFLIQI